MNKKLTLSIVLVVILGFLYTGLSLFSQMQTPTTNKPLSDVSFSQTDTIHSVPAGVPVLMYHSIGEEANNDAVIGKERFYQHMEYLHQHNYHTISLDELRAYLTMKKELPLKPVVITFDDGYRDTYEIALPILKQYGFKSVLFMPVNEVGKRLSWQELQEMKATGMEIASHSVNHRSLGDLSQEEQRKEIRDSKAVLDGHLGQDTRSFCYPNGSYTAETLQLLPANGFDLAFTIQPGWVKSGDNPLTLRRIWLGNSVDLVHFEERLNKENYSML